MQVVIAKEIYERYNSTNEKQRNAFPGEKLTGLDAVDKVYNE